LRAHPTQLAGRAAIHEKFGQGTTGGAGDGQSLRRDFGKRSRVFFGPNAYFGINMADPVFGEGRHPFELLIVGFGIENLLKAVDPYIGDGERAAPQCLPVTFADEGRCDGICADGNDITVFEFQ
jgi:hypothetical protein